MKRQHPAAIIGYTTKNFWLLLIPLIRGLASLSFDFSRWAEGAEWDILAVSVMIAAAVIRWYFTYYEIGDSDLSVKTGAFMKKSLVIPYSAVCAVTTEQNLFHAWLGAVRIYVDTDAAVGKRSLADISLIISKPERGMLINGLSKVFTKENRAGYTYKVSKSVLVVFSLLFSSAISGVALLITLLSGGADIIGEQLEREFMLAVNNFSDAVANLAGRLISGISPAGIAISVIIGVGFLISFVITIMRHMSFTATRRGKCIIISGGLAVKRTYCINCEKINMADMRQNLIMKLLGIASLHVNCTGYGKRKNEIPVFIPICKVKDDRDIRLLLPDFSVPEGTVNPRISYLWRFIWKAGLIVIVIPFLGLLSLMLFPSWHSLEAFLVVMAEIPAVWYLFAKACAYCTNGLGITDRSVCAVYCSGYAFHNVSVPIERVSEIRITSSFFQRFTRSCDVIIYTNSEYIGGHRIRNIPIIEAERLIRRKFS